jgi:hypothetical protein
MHDLMVSEYIKQINATCLPACVKSDLVFFSHQSNSNSLANQFGIHIILAKQEKLASNSLANQLGKNRNLAKLTSPRAYMRARIVVAIVVSL